MNEKRKIIGVSLSAILATSLVGGVSSSILANETQISTAKPQVLKCGFSAYVKPKTKAEAKRNLDNVAANLAAAKAAYETALANVANAKAEAIASDKELDDAEVALLAALSDVQKRYQQLLNDAQNNVAILKTDFEAKNKAYQVAEDDYYNKKNAYQNADTAFKQSQNDYNAILAANPNAEKELELKKQELSLQREKVDNAKDGDIRARDNFKKADNALDAADYILRRATEDENAAIKVVEELTQRVANYQTQYDDAKARLDAVTKGTLEYDEAHNAFLKIDLDLATAKNALNQNKITETDRKAEKDRAELAYNEAVNAKKIANEEVNTKAQVLSDEEAHLSQIQKDCDDLQTTVDNINVVKHTMDDYQTKLVASQATFKQAEDALNNASNVAEKAQIDLYHARILLNYLLAIDINNSTTYQDFPDMVSAIANLNKMKENYGVVADKTNAVQKAYFNQTDLADAAKTTYLDAQAIYAMAKADYDAFKDDEVSNVPNTGDFSNLDLTTLSLIGAASVMAASRKRSKQNQ